MKKYILAIVLFLFFKGCSHEHQINIGDISLDAKASSTLKHQEYYMSFTQEYYDNKMYPLDQYCDDQRTYLADDKFSTETYLQVSNERTKQDRIGKYPIWFLLNDDASDISCVRKSANFINTKPFVVNGNDDLSVKLLQKNEAETAVPVEELSLLMDVVSLVVPRTASFLLKASDIVENPITEKYLTLVDKSLKHGDLDSSKSRDFKTDVTSVKVKLYVPSKKGEKRELGYILLKPKYRSTLSTVTTSNGIPNFQFVYHSTDPQIKDLMEYELESKKINIKTVVDNFRQVSNDHVMEALLSLNTELKNSFTRFDRALILNLALRQSDFYKGFKQSIVTNNASNVQKYMQHLNNKQNPLLDLREELKVTKCEYYSLMYQAQELIKQANIATGKEAAESQRLKDEALRYQMEMQGVENFLSPVANWQYMPQMFSSDVNILKTTGEQLSVNELTDTYNRKENVNDYGCYVALQKPIQIQLNRSNQKQQLSIQNYLIHPNYTRGINYDYMALSVNKRNEMDTVFYKLSGEGDFRIKNILIDSSNLFVNKNRIKEIINMKKAQSCSENIRRMF